ncbi:hypothetical protein VNO77_23051 [Canavalia gladiata]|uniref:Uncharacterized protein n=1 Tax=Canavalia gladiata TaxID=3824 RepID=A0AAN9L772_CANGL
MLTSPGPEIHPGQKNCAVKRAWARVVLGWVTSLEVLVLHLLLFASVRLVPFVTRTRMVLIGQILLGSEGRAGTAAGRFPNPAAPILGVAAKPPKRAPERVSGVEVDINRATPVRDGGGLRMRFPAAPPGPRDSSRIESYDRLKRARRLCEGIKQLIAPHLTGTIIPALMHRIPSELRS